MSETTYSELTQSLLRIFKRGREEVFQNGMESIFSRDFTALLETHGVSALVALDALLESGAQLSDEVIGEACRWMGHLEQPTTHVYRRHILCRLLCTSKRSLDVRDGALLGLASLDDPDALPCVEYALEREASDDFKRMIQQVVDQLRETKRERDDAIGGARVTIEGDQGVKFTDTIDRPYAIPEVVDQLHALGVNIIERYQVIYGVRPFVVSVYRRDVSLTLERTDEGRVEITLNLDNNHDL